MASATSDTPSVSVAVRRVTRTPGARPASEDGRPSGCYGTAASRATGATDGGAARPFLTNPGYDVGVPAYARYPWCVTTGQGTRGTSTASAGSVSSIRRTPVPLAWWPAS